MAAGALHLGGGRCTLRPRARTGSERGHLRLLRGLLGGRPPEQAVARCARRAFRPDLVRHQPGDDDAHGALRKRNRPRGAGRHVCREAHADSERRQAEHPRPTPRLQALERLAVRVPVHHRAPHHRHGHSAGGLRLHTCRRRRDGSNRSRSGRPQDSGAPLHGGHPGLDSHAHLPLCA